MNKGNLASALRDFANGNRVLVDATDFDRPAICRQKRPMAVVTTRKALKARQVERRTARLFFGRA